MSRSFRLPLLFVLSLLLVAGACASSAPTEVDASAKEAPTTTTAAAPATTAPVPSSVMVARTDRELDIHPARGDDSVARTLPATTEFTLRLEDGTTVTASAIVRDEN